MGNMLRRILLPLLTLVLLTSSAQAQFGLLGPVERVQAELIADTTAIEPGRSFRLGVRYQIDPEWHIYWKTSGDAGLPTEITWRLPEGFRIGEIQWPVPERFVDGEIVTYAYSDEVVLVAEVIAPEALDPAVESWTFGADSHWLVCKVECVPGEKIGMELTLPAGVAAPSQHAPLFEHWAALTPDPTAAEQPLKLELAEEPQALAPGEEFAVQLRLRAAETEWSIDEAAVEADPASMGIFPVFSDPWEVTHPERGELDAGGAQFDWTVRVRPDYRPQAGAEETLRAEARAPLVGPGGAQRVAVAQFNLPIGIVGGASAGATPEPAAPATARADDAGGLAESAGAEADGAPFSFLAAREEVRHSLLKFLLFAFIGGLILNVMPCVLPVVSLKVMSFVRQAGEEPGRVFRLGLSFAGGVLASFAVLAAVVIGLKLAGAQVGWGFHMQEPRFVIVMTGVVFALGLSLFGVWEIGLPGAATNKLDGATRREGYGGAFFNGVLATALATPCTAPVLGAALGFAFSQPPAVIMLFFLTIGAGLAFPYVLLALNPGWLRFLPRPGHWMDTFRQTMGFLLMATVVWLVWVLGGQIGPDGVALTLGFLLMVGVACWLLGKGFDYQASVARRRVSVAAALALVLGGYWLMPERYIRFMSGAGATAAAMAQVTPQTTPAATEQAPAVDAAGQILWQPFSVERVEQLAAGGRTIFLDFTADWCVTCKVNEAGALASTAVREAFAEHHVAAVKGDWTRRDPTIGRVLSYFERSGVPLYVVFPADRPQDYIVLSELLTPQAVVGAIEKAAGPATETAQN